LSIPEDAKLSPESTDILKRLLCDVNDRLGANGIHEIKNHPFFKNINWTHVYNKNYEPITLITAIN